MTNHYMLISFIIIFVAMLPFFIRFERSKPQAREIVIIAVMVATCVVGRAVFFMVPNFKPIIAIIIISGISLGRESGFIVGAMAAFVSNFMFGQGPWTPFQMIAMALGGYLAGLIFHRYTLTLENGKAKQLKLGPVVAYGVIYTFFIYGGIVDLWTILSMTETPTIATVIGVYAAALWFNVIHAAAVGIFLALLTHPMNDKLTRVKIKYGMTEFS